MENLILKSNPKVNDVFDHYPDNVKSKMNFLRELVIQTAEETSDINELEETLKWGEPSFITKIGSTLRMDWKSKSPDQYAMYFQCTSRLVSTFKIVYRDTFKFEGNRAIIFNLNDEIPVPELKECIKAALTYHKVKNLITLGI
ncbi:DUF1801 domain-containing protein [Marinigracilibium pacificum]|uniref:DUF1801 domain-containing protein n=1 Tax=Marinigracilibium pacificum TaxID=2729599 RepID=A0A848IZR5_9BACT|nr:DUF1801 domain-containing protein [Marinigracilibium pacificum]NMM47714.1 DUF1801 domain-containing protein [Marinigracilibium pacificum]